MKFRLLNIVTIAVLASMLWAGHAAMPIRWWWFALVIWAYVSVVFLGCVKLSLNLFLPVISEAKTNEKVVALSFDDGPDADHSASILDTLKQHNVPAAFFCIGKNIAGNEAIVQRWKDEGHMVGNHSYSHHFWFDMFGSAKMLADMQQMDAATERVIGSKPRLFRPPYGVMNPNLAKAIKKGRYIPVGWSIRSFDTKIKDKQTLLLRIMDRVKPGAIILLHDSMQVTAEVLPQLITELHNKGYRIKRLDKMLNLEPYA